MACMKRDALRVLFSFGLSPFPPHLSLSATLLKSLPEAHIGDA